MKFIAALVAILLAGCCPAYQRLDRTEIAKYREVVITDLQDIVIECYDARADEVEDRDDFERPTDRE